MPLGTPFFNITPVGSGGSVAGVLVKVTAGRLHWISVFNGNAAQRFFQVFDSATVPLDGAIPTYIQALSATSSSAKELAFPPEGFKFTNGLYVCTSSTGPTKTLAAADLFYTLGIS